LLCVGAVSLALLVGTTMRRRTADGFYVVAELAIVLFAVGLARDLS
jgi:hypothetical protein